MSGVFTAVLAMLSVAQGDALRLELPHQDKLEKVDVRWRDRTVPLARSGDIWIAILGVDLDLAAGDYPAPVTFVYADGSTEVHRETVHVTPKDFPLTRLTVEPRFVELSPGDLERSNRESVRLDRVFAAVTPAIYWSEPFEVPIPGGRGSNFGHRRVFNDQPRAPHSGADITAAEGTPIHATNRGVVVDTGNYFFNGNTVIVDHGQGVFSVYLHLSRIDVEVGQTVERDEVLGLVGATGRVTGPHLHWGFRIQNARVDPFSLTRFH